MKDKKLIKNKHLEITKTRTRFEELVVRNVKYKCEVSTYRLLNSNPEFKTDVLYTMWRSKNLRLPVRSLGSAPGLGLVPSLLMGSDILRAEISAKTPYGVRNSSIQVVSLKDERKIGSRTFACIREEGTVDSKLSNENGKEILSLKGNQRRWLSIDVPGHTVHVLKTGIENKRKMEYSWKVSKFYVAKTE